MYISKKVLIILGIVITLLISSDFLLDYLKTNNSTTNIAKVELDEDTSEKVDRQKERFITLFQDEDYNTLYKETGNQETNFIRDMHSIATAFQKFKEVQTKHDSDTYYSDIDKLNDYNVIVDNLKFLKETPNEIKPKVDELLDYGQRNYQWVYNAKNPEDKGNGVPTIGMTRYEVLKTTWKNPSDINTTKTALSINEQWVYGLTRYLYFEDGRLTSIQN
ncbi:DUF2845 domain-containing protein [Fictibacillus nanhaiensis]|uniref:DUF2845 domain-containing protein n=1 Tax=Fictibacillus nanhaiensis TaxID=742169 RepID=UPI0020420BF2|nr:DUF2845 domain-containing protein [Fictibacillus nanhaiensis]MCM3730092.1 DUF2845 domain-containing protein [Fictibacillus nanhaiensis]